MIGAAIGTIHTCPICGGVLASALVKCGGVKPPPFGLKKLREHCGSTAASRLRFTQRREALAAAVASRPELARRGEIVLEEVAS